MNYGYNLEHTSYTEVTREADPEDSWGADDLLTSWDITANITESDKSSPDIITSFKLNFDKNYYVVYVVYNTGDSFHHHSGYECVFVELFQEKEKADNLVKTIIKHNKDYNNNKDLGENAYRLVYKDQENNNKTISCDWNGYFESIETCEVKTVNLQFISKNKLKYKK